MNLKQYDIELDIKQGKNIPHIEVVSGDTESNIFNITLKDDEETYSLTDTIVTIIFHKADKTDVTQSTIDSELPLIVTDNVIACTLKTNTIAKAGRVLAEVIVTDLDGKILTSQRFQFYVRQSLMTDEVVESTNEFPMFSTILTDELARKSAEDLRVIAETGRDDAEGLRVQAESDRETAFDTALNDFGTDSQDAIDDFIAETELVESEYPVRLTTVEDDLVAHKADYVALEGKVDSLYIEEGQPWEVV